MSIVPALQFAGYFEYFDYSRIQLIGKVEYSYLKMHDDDYIREMTEKIFKAGIPCMIFCRGLEPRPLFMELGNKYGVPVLATDDGTSSFFSELNRFPEDRAGTENFHPWSFSGCVW